MTEKAKLNSLLIRKRYSIDQNAFDFAFNQKNKQSTKLNQPNILSKKDLFVFKRKNVDQAEYFNAKSVVNLDIDEDEESEK